MQVNDNNERKRMFLVELMIAICLLALVFLGSFILIKGIIDNSKTQMDDTTKNIIIETAEDYTKEYRESDEWKEEVNNGNKCFCIALDLMFDLKNNSNENYIEQYKDKYIVKISLENDIYDYQVIEKELVGDKCNYYK